MNESSNKSCKNNTRSFLFAIKPLASLVVHNVRHSCTSHILYTSSENIPQNLPKHNNFIVQLNGQVLIVFCFFVWWLLILQCFTPNKWFDIIHQPLLYSLQSTKILAHFLLLKMRHYLCHNTFKNKGTNRMVFSAFDKQYLQ